jgi:HlyD family secretion protein
VDIVRSRGRAKPARILVPVAVAALLVAGAYSAITQLRPQPNEPVVERNAIVTDTAIRGDLVRAVRAPGTFVAERVRVVDAPADGTIDAIPVRVGSTVAAGTAVAVMSDPDLDASITDTQAQIVAARAELRQVQEEARASQLDRAATVAAALSDYRQLEEDAARYADLHAAGLVSDFAYKVAQIKAAAARDAVGFDRRKITVDAAQAQANAAVAQAHITELTAALAAKEAQRRALAVRAGAGGVVASIAVERGARVTAGTQIARIVGQRNLKATLEVPESDIRDVSAGLAAAIDTQNGVVRGHVARIDPAAQNGAVAVDVTIDGTLPPNARPNLHIDGTVEIERLRDVVSIARPANAADDTSMDVYRLVDNDTRALRTRIRLGRGSLDRVAVSAGLAPGMLVITSDTSAFNAAALRVQ